VSPVKYEVGFYIPEDYILHSHRRVNLKSYIKKLEFFILIFKLVASGYKDNIFLHNLCIYVVTKWQQWTCISSMPQKVRFHC
jgi:hypothetical protein